MEILKKNIENKEDPRQDNSDKPQLFSKERRPRTANEHKDEWSFINDTAIRENIAYQMQYLEFQIHLYNDYQIYLTIESLMCKNIMTIIGGVIESALNNLVSSHIKDGGYLFDDRITFLQLIDDSHKFEIINNSLRDDFHELRKKRNLLHLSSISYKEHSAYTIEEANYYINTLNNFTSLMNRSTKYV